MPTPKDVRAVAPDSATQPPAEPTIKLLSEFDRAASAAKSASYACTSEPIATPRFVLAPDAVEDPVPPCNTPTSVASQVPVAIVPMPVIFVWDAVVNVPEMFEKLPATAAVPPIITLSMEPPVISKFEPSISTAPASNFLPSTIFSLPFVVTNARYELPASVISRADALLSSILMSLAAVKSM